MYLNNVKLTQPKDKMFSMFFCLSANLLFYAKSENYNGYYLIGCSFTKITNPIHG